MQKTTPSRYPSRSTSTTEDLYSIIDSGLFCTVAFIRDGVAHQIPTGFARMENNIYIHSSAKSGFMESIISQRVSFSITLMDALVLAPTAFDSSFNYRSVVGFSDVEEIVEPGEKLKFFNLFTDRYIPDRIADVGEPTPDQVRVTRIAKLSLDNAAAKVRSGGVNMKLEEHEKWSGIIPMFLSYGEPQMDHQLSKECSLPDYIKNLVE